MIDVRHALEQELAALLAPILLDVPVLPGRANGDRPPEYVCVIVEKCEAKSSTGHVFLASVSVISVIPADEPDAVERSTARFRVICDYFRSSSCQFASVFDDVTVYGFSIVAQEDAQRDRSHGDVLRLLAGVGPTVA
jgi:hypothetical protein